MIEEFPYYSATVQAIFEPFLHLEKGNKPIKFISTSSSEVVSGTLFVPLRGNRDGHEFIPDALKRGAEFFLCEKRHPILSSLAEEERKGAILVDDTLLALGKLASFHRDRFNPLVIAITGSSGKTTTKEFFKACLSYFGESLVVTEKNYNNEIGVPFTLFRINEKTKIVVCEMGMNHRYEISRLSKMAKPHISLITNIGPAHIENLGSIEEIARAKMEIIDGMDGGKLYLPMELGENGGQLREIITSKEIENKSDIANKKLELTKFIYFSLDKNNGLSIQTQRPDGFTLKIFDKIVEWNFPSRKLLSNLAGVLHVLQDLGLNKYEIAEGIAKFQFGDKRNLLISGKYQILDDTYNANPDSMKSSLETLEQFANNKKFYAILGDMKELGEFSEYYHRDIGEYCAKLGLDKLISFGIDARWILESFLLKAPENSGKHFLKEEIDLVVEKVQKEWEVGSFVLVKGSRSMKMEEIVERLKNL